MSGEAAGGLGVLLVAPFILPVVAAGAVVAGTAAVTAYAVKAAQEEYALQELRKQQNEVLGKCSKAIAEHQRALNMKFDAISRANDAVFSDISRVNETAFLEISGKAMKAPAQWTKSDILRTAEEFGIDVISDCRKSLFERLDQTFASEFVRMEQQFREVRADLQQENEEAVSVRKKIEKMEADLSSESRKKEETASAYINDAENLTEYVSLKSRMYDGLKSEQVHILETELKRAKNDLSEGLYDKAIDELFGIILRADSLAGDIEYEGIRRRLLQTGLKLRYEYLIAWINESRYIDRDADEIYCHDIHEDLNDFSQGRIQDLLQLLEKRKSEMEDPQTWTERLFQERTWEYDNRLAPYAENLMTDAYAVMQNYLKKLDILEALTPFMQEQGFDIEWSAAKGDDLSQKVVANFKSVQTKGEISVLIDSESPLDADSTMAIELLSFRESGGAGLEQRRNDLRHGLMQRLAENSIVTRQAISCIMDTQNQSSKRIDYNDMNTVKASRPSAIDMG